MTPESAIPFEKLPATPELARDYIASFERVSGLFRGPYSDISNHLDEARALSTRSYPRKELAIRLVERNAVLGADPEALASAEALLDPRTFVVITGQQTGIYTGPLYTIYKAITAISLARRLDEATDEFRFVPMFWCASEDHDLDEINHLFLPDGDVVRKHIAPFATDGRPAGGVTVDADLLDFHDTIRQTLGETIFRDPLIAELAPRNGESIATWFERSLLRLLAGTGMIVVDPEWIRDLAAPVFRGAIEHRAEIEDRVESALARVATSIENQKCQRHRTGNDQKQKPQRALPLVFTLAGLLTKRWGEIAALCFGSYRSDPRNQDWRRPPQLELQPPELVQARVPELVLVLPGA